LGRDWLQSYYKNCAAGEVELSDMWQAHCSMEHDSVKALNSGNFEQIKALFLSSCNLYSQYYSIVANKEKYTTTQKLGPNIDRYIILAPHGV
jgi:hypothetical protein